MGRAQFKNNLEVFLIKKFELFVYKVWTRLKVFNLQELSLIKFGSSIDKGLRLETRMKVLCSCHNPCLVT